MYKLEVTQRDSSTTMIKADTYEELQQKLDEFYIYNSHKIY